MTTLLSVKDTAKTLSCSEVTVRRMVDDGRLPSVRVNRSLRIPQDAVEALILLSTVTR